MPRAKKYIVLTEEQKDAAYDRYTSSPAHLTSLSSLSAWLKNEYNLQHAPDPSSLGKMIRKRRKEYDQGQRQQSNKKSRSNGRFPVSNFFFVVLHA